MPILEAQLSKAPVHNDGHRITRAVCTVCDWSYESPADESPVYAEARAKAHRHQSRHGTELRCDILDLLLERFEPRSDDDADTHTAMDCNCPGETCPTHGGEGKETSEALPK